MLGKRIIANGQGKNHGFMLINCVGNLVNRLEVLIFVSNSFLMILVAIVKSLSILIRTAKRKLNGLLMSKIMLPRIGIKRLGKNSSLIVPYMCKNGGFVSDSKIFKEAINGYGFEEVEQSPDGIY